MQDRSLVVVGAEGSSEELLRVRTVSAKRASLEAEIETLREALAQVVRSMRIGEEEDAAKMAMAVARLSDSIVRALVAQQKLSAQDEGFSWLRAQFDRMLRELGYGEES